MKKYVLCNVCGQRDVPSHGNVGTSVKMRCSDCSDDSGRASRCRAHCVTGHKTRFTDDFAAIRPAVDRAKTKG